MQSTTMISSNIIMKTSCVLLAFLAISASAKKAKKSESCDAEDLLVVSFTTDRYPRETSWKLISSQDGDTVLQKNKSDYKKKSKLYKDKLCLTDELQNRCFLLEVKDSYGDGIGSCYGNDPEECGSYHVKLNDEILAEGGRKIEDWTHETRHEFCVGDATFPPTDSPSESPTFDCDTDQLLSIAIKTDNWPHETSWKLMSQDGKTILSKATRDYQLKKHLYEDLFCLKDFEPQCFTFEIRDTYGDGLSEGWCQSYGNTASCGSYKLTLNEEAVVSSGTEGGWKKQTSRFCPGVPTEMPAPAPTESGNRTRFLVWDGEEMKVEEASSDDDYNNSNNRAATMKEVGVMMNQAPFAYDNERKICQEVDTKLVDNEANRELCKNYLDLPYFKTPKEQCSSTTEAQSKIPKKYFSVSKSNDQSYEQLGVTLSNPSYERRHYGDEEAYEYVKERCGSNAAEAYRCLAPPAYRADLFRFCALYVEGGLYLDSDIIPLVPLEELYDPCSVATVGHDWPQGRPQKQMKILAGRAGAPIFSCMIHKIVSNVRSRSYPDNPLALTGPMALHECYDEHPENVSITYHDTRDASFPYTGMRAVGDKLLAFESPGNRINNNSRRENYQIDFNKHEVYRPTCRLRNHGIGNNTDKPVEVASANSQRVNSI